MTLVATLADAALHQLADAKSLVAAAVVQLLLQHLLQKRLQCHLHQL